MGMTMMLPLPVWHCRIGRIQLKPGASLTVPFACGNFY